ncbi:acyltransferase family protein [Escherichia coli]
MLTAIPLLTLPQFIMLQYVKGKAESWPGLSLYDKYNTLAWELISHLWFLLVLVVMTTLCVWIFKRIRNNLENSDKTNKKFSMVKLSVIFLCLGIGYAVIRRTIFIVYPPILSNGMFNFIVMQTLFYLPVLYRAHWLSFSLILKPCLPRRRGRTLAAALAFVAYLLNQRYGSGDAWMYETESVITMVLGRGW